MASIQQSLNNMFATALGAGLTVSHTPAVKEMLENRALNRERQYLSDEVNKTMKGLNDLQFNSEEDIAIADAAINATEEMSHDILRQQVKLRQPDAIKNYAARAGTVEGNRLTLNDRVEDFAKRQEEAQRQRKEVERAVEERRKIIEQLKGMGVNIDNARRITNINTGERIK